MELQPRAHKKTDPVVTEGIDPPLVSRGEAIFALQQALGTFSLKPNARSFLEQHLADLNNEADNSQSLEV